MNAPAGPSAASTIVIPLANRVTLDGFSVAGPSRRFDEASKAEIPQLWSVLTGALPLKAQVPGGATYGVVWDTDRETGSFQYLAGVGVAPGRELPGGFRELQVPAATYAVFRITLDGTALHPQVKSAMAKIWGELVPASRLQVIDGPAFERYDGHFEPTRPGAIIDFYVPVAA